MLEGTLLKSLAGGGGGVGGFVIAVVQTQPHQDFNVKLCVVPRPPAPAVYQEDCLQRSGKNLRSQMW